MYGVNALPKNRFAVYLDTDGSMQEGQCAISSNVFMINRGAVLWYSKQQEIVLLSTTESEYITLTHTTKEAVWICQLIDQLFGCIVKARCVPVYCNNKSTIALTKDHQYHARTKHIDIRYHFIRWLCENDTIRIIYCPTGEMVADILTKALPSLKVKHFAKELGLRTIWGGVL